MSDTLTQDHQRLQQQLETFLDQARENELKMRRFHEQELRLIGTRSLSELIEMILYNYRSEFGLETVSLVLFDPEYEIQRILEEEGVRFEEHSGLLFVTSRDMLDELFDSSLKPALGRYTAERHQRLFAHQTRALQSVALLPLVRYGDLIGSFNLGSESAQRFSQESATDFLQRLSTIVAICLENAANHERLKRVGLTDSLTGINNRRFFDQRLHEEIARGLRTREPIACLFLDVDYFKKINDNYGHHVGDRVLRQVANLIREQLRNCDVLGRYGGEEFAALLDNTGPGSALEIAQRIRQSIEQHQFLLPDDLQQSPFNVTISIGVASLDTVRGNANVTTLGQHLLEQADQALYRAKEAGRNRVMLYEAQCDDNSRDHTKAFTRLKQFVI
jgi:two-component system cell cycle response regulator